MRLSLRAGRETLNARHWGRWTRRAREALRKARGTSFEAMVDVRIGEAFAGGRDVVELLPKFG